MSALAPLLRRSFLDSVRRIAYSCNGKVPRFR